MSTAARIRWAKFRIAAVAFVALLILGVLLALLTGGRLFRSYSSLYIYMPDAAGLGAQASVRLNGIPIGTVERVGFSGVKDPERGIVAELKIDTTYLSQIPVDSVASLTAENAVGDKYVDITRGKSRTHMRAGATVPFAPPTDVMERVDMAEFEARMRAIDLLLADIQAGESTVGKFFVGDQLYRETVAAIGNLEKAVDSAAGAQRTFGRLLYSAEAYNNILQTVRRLDDQFAAVERGEGYGRYLRDSSQYDSIRGRLAGMRRSVEDMGKSKFLADDAAYTRWVSVINGLIRNIDELNRGEGSMGTLFVSAQPYESMTGSSRDLAQSLSEFREDPQSFVRITIF
jgi:hypothetical protein